MLIEQITDRQVFRIIANSHGRNDFLAIEEDRQSPLDSHGSLDPRASLVDPAHTLGQPWVVGIGPDDVAALVFAHCSIITDILPQHENCPTKVGSVARFVHASCNTLRRSFPCRASST